MPPVPTTTRSTSSRVASSSRASVRPPTLGAGRQVEPAGGRRVPGRATTPVGSRRACSSRRLGLATGRQGDDPDRIAETDQHIDRLATDRAARAEQCDPDRAAGAAPALIAGT